MFFGSISVESGPPPFIRTGQPPCSATGGVVGAPALEARTGQPLGAAAAAGGSAGLAGELAVCPIPPVDACNFAVHTMVMVGVCTPARMGFFLGVTLGVGGVTLPHASPRALACRASRSTCRITASGAGRGDENEPPQWTAKQLMREEIESPFRKPRQAIAAFSAFSASIGLLVSGSRALACALGGACLQPLDELLPNIGVNVGVVGFAAVTLWNDQRQQASKLRRIARGAELAALQLSAVDPAGAIEGASNIAVTDMRKKRRVVIVAGGPAVYARAISSASEHAAVLRQGEVVLVPVLLREGAVPAQKLVDPAGCTGGVSAAEAPWGDAASVGYTPRGPEAWGRWLSAEVETAVKQGMDVQANGITIAIKKSGKIGKRSTSVPSWPGLVDTLQITDANFGMPKF